MLTLLRVANYAIIDEIEVELDSGFSVMTGETGAGKSILVDALGLALGDRADAAAVRNGAKRAEISAVFELDQDHPAAKWLIDRGLDDEDICCLRRLISAEGRSRGFINNQPVTLQDLRHLGGMLVDIHGQHAHQSLLGSAQQRQLLDAGAGLLALAAEAAAAFEAWQSNARELSSRLDHSAEREAQLDLLRFQLAELDELDLQEGEAEALQSESRRLANVDRLLAGIAGALEQLYDSDDRAAHAQVVSAARSLDSIATHDEALAAIAGRLGETEIELQEIASDLTHYRDKLETDPARLDEIEQRRDRIQHLARRHRCDEAQLHTVLDQLRSEIEQLDTSSEALLALEQQTDAARTLYFDRAEALSAGRARYAAALGTEVSTKLKELGMPQAAFLVTVERKPEGREDATGIDRIAFNVRVNPGQPFGPISKVASGGELSRIGLALEVVATAASTIPTFIFDEVDAGIGGGVAEIVGRRLRQIALQRQVLCVTHLAQVASQAASHYRIVKLTDGKSSRTQVRRLGSKDRVEELSRMIGGIEITDATRAHAEEMINQASAANDPSVKRPS